MERDGENKFRSVRQACQRSCMVRPHYPRAEAPLEASVQLSASLVGVTLTTWLNVKRTFRRKIAAIPYLA